MQAGWQADRPTIAAAPAGQPRPDSQNSKGGDNNDAQGERGCIATHSKQQHNNFTPAISSCRNGGKHLLKK